MREMGYQFHDAPEYSEKDGGHFSSGHRWMVAVLDMKQCSQTARQVLRARTEKQSQLFPWHGDTPLRGGLTIY